jgi:hypothetical protein
LKRQQDEHDGPRKKWKKQQKGEESKGKGKGKGKGASKGKSGKNKLGCAYKTPEGLSVCFDFNNPDIGCKKQNFLFENVCGICFGNHPMQKCRGNKGRAPTETQGEGVGAA